MDHATGTLPPPRVERFLRTEEVLWLSTFGTDGFPGLVPIWFSWDGEAIRLVTKPNAEKVTDMRADPRVMVALGNAEDDFDVGLIEARAELLDTDAADFLPESHWTKYAKDLVSIGLGREEYLRTYSQSVRLVPVRYLGWHGRTDPGVGGPTRPQRGRRAVCRVTMPRVRGSQRMSASPASRMTPAIRSGSG
jgi:PPOX class probable F420-dependent enzyme